MNVEDKFAEVEFRPERLPDGAPIVRAYVDGKYLGDEVINTATGEVLIRVANEILRPQLPGEIYGALLPSEYPFP